MKLKDIMEQASSEIQKEVTDKYAGEIKTIMKNLREAKRLVANLSKELVKTGEKIEQDIADIEDLSDIPKTKKGKKASS